MKNYGIKKYTSSQNPFVKWRARRRCLAASKNLGAKGILPSFGLKMLYMQYMKNTWYSRIFHLSTSANDLYTLNNMIVRMNDTFSTTVQQNNINTSIKKTGRVGRVVRVVASCSGYREWDLYSISPRLWDFSSVSSLLLPIYSPPSASLVGV